MKGLILAGGHGTRLYPMTKAVSKQLLPIYDKPMIYYPLSTLLLAGISEILIISSPDNLPSYQQLLGDGTDLGISLQYKVQNSPGGLPEAFILGEEFIDGDKSCLILGDNFFFGQDLTASLNRAMDFEFGASILGYSVSEPSAYGVIALDKFGYISNLVEKPKNPPSNLAIPGIYFFDNNVCELVKNLKPSSRGELEIVDLLKNYLQIGMLNHHILGRGIAWLDTGTPRGILRASEFVETVQTRQGFYISCIEEIAWRRGFISRDQLLSIGKSLYMTDYGKYIISIAEAEI